MIFFMSNQPPQPHPDDSDFDLDLDRVFTPLSEQASEWANPLPKPGPRVVAGKSESPPAKTQVTPEAEEDAPSALEKGKGKFHRKEGDQALAFKHYVSRPPAVAPRATAPAGPNDHGTFGRKKDAEQLPDLTPNKAHIVLNEAFQHTPALDVDPGAVSRALKFLALIAILGTFGYMLQQFIRVQNKEVPNSNQTAAVSAEPVEVRAQKALVFLQRFLEMKSPEEKLASILDADRLSQSVKDHYSNPNNSDPTTVSIEPMPSKVVGDRYRFAYGIKEVGTDRRLQAIVHETADGFKIDWEHLVNLGSIPWARFIQDTPTTPTEMRATVEATSNSPGIYEDGTKFRAYKISHQSGPPHLIGYADAESRAAQNLDKLTHSGQNAALVKIFLSFDQSRDLKLVKIVNVSLDEL